jgi:hypothetical protein
MILHAAIRELQVYFAKCGESRITSRVMRWFGFIQKPNKIKASFYLPFREVRRTVTFALKIAFITAGIAFAQVTSHRD